MKKFIREDRYFVAKRKDLEQLTETEAAVFLAIAKRLHQIRKARGAMPNIEAVVVESDWPEYNPVWAAIEERVTNR